MPRSISTICPDLLRELIDAPTDHLRSLRLLMQAVGFQLAILTLDALALWLAFNVLGDVPALRVVFVSVAIASMVTTIGPIPVGVRTFEGASVARTELARRVCRSGAGRDALAALNDLWAPDVARRLACAT